MHRADIFTQDMVAVDICRQSVADDWPAEIEIRLPLLVRRFVRSERISRVQRFILELKSKIAVERADARALNDVGVHGLPAEITLFGRE